MAISGPSLLTIHPLIREREHRHVLRFSYQSFPNGDDAQHGFRRRWCAGIALFAALRHRLRILVRFPACGNQRDLTRCSMTSTGHGQNAPGPVEPRVPALWRSGSESGAHGLCRWRRFEQQAFQRSDQCRCRAGPPIVKVDRRLGRDRP